MADKQSYRPTWTTVTPVKPVEKKTTVTPILPPMVGSKLVAPVLPPVPVKLATPVTPPVVKKNETPLLPGRIAVNKVTTYDPTTYEKTNDIDYWSRTLKGQDLTLAKPKELAAHKKAKAYLEKQAELGTEIGNLYKSNMPRQVPGWTRSESYNDRYSVDRTMQELTHTLRFVPKDVVNQFLSFRKYELGPGFQEGSRLDSRPEVVGPALAQLTPAQRETFLSLGKGWVGTNDELIAAAKSLAD